MFSPKPEPLVGPTGREALLCVGSAGLYVQSLFRAEDALEVGIHAHNDLAREVGIGDGSVGEDERAPARAPLLRRRSSVAGALDQFVLGLRIADHLVLLPVGGGLGSPPVTLGVGLGLVWISDARMSYPRTNAANRSAD